MIEIALIYTLFSVDFTLIWFTMLKNALKRCYMAKAKLSKSAIAFIVRLRNDPNTTYGYQEIADMVKSSYSVEVSLQAVSLAYKKFKDSSEIKEINDRLLNTENSDSNLSTENLNTVVEDKTSNKTLSNNVSKTDSIGTENKRSAPKAKKGFNDDLGKDISKSDVKDLLN